MIIVSQGNAGIAAMPGGQALLDVWRAGRIGGRELEERLKAIRIAHLLRQQEAGVDWIPVGDITPGDRMREHASAFGLAPERPAEAGAGACAKTDAEPRLVRNPWAGAFREARAHLKALPVPVMIGPYTFAKRLEAEAGAESRPGGFDAGDLLMRLTPAYAEALRGIGEAGAEWVQLEEPELARPVAPADWPLIGLAYRMLRDAAPKLRLMLQLAGGVPDDLSRLHALPVAGIGLDFTPDGGRALAAVAKHGFPEDRVLGAGIIDGRPIWRSDLRAACALLEDLRRLAPRVRLALQPSCSLSHAPAAFPDGLAPRGLPAYALATADVKLGELRVLRAALAEGPEAVRLDLADSDVLQEMLRALLPVPPLHAASLAKATAARPA